MFICFVLGPAYWRSLLGTPRVLVLFLVLFGLLYLSQVLVGRWWLFGPGAFSPGAERQKICSSCHTIHFTESDACPCGGQLEDLEYWKYVADEHV